MRAFTSPALALGFGVFLPLAETVRRWGNWPFLPFLLDDWLAGGFLIYAALRCRRDWKDGRPFLAAAWAFNSGMAYGSFFTHLDHWAQPPETGWLPHSALVVVIGALFALSLLGLVSTLLKQAPPSND